MVTPSHLLARRIIRRSPMAYHGQTEKDRPGDDERNCARNDKECKLDGGMIQEYPG